MIKTKIICTIGPAVNSVEKMIELMEAGMNVARLNFSHGTQDEHLQSINYLKEAREHLKCPLAIMLDTKGPEIRLGKFKDGQVFLKAGQPLLLLKDEVVGDATQVTLLPGNILAQLTVGTRILFDYG